VNRDIFGRFTDLPGDDEVEEAVEDVDDLLRRARVVLEGARDRDFLVGEGFDDGGGIEGVWRVGAEGDFSQAASQGKAKAKSARRFMVLSPTWSDD